MTTLLYNGRIYQQRDCFVQAMMIEDTEISRCGSTEEILSLRKPNDLCIDLGGKTVVPGFNDSHMHFLMSAITFTTVDLYGASSIGSILDRASRFLVEHSDENRTTLFGRGWNQDYFQDEVRLLTRFDLDGISTDIPIVFVRACGHVMTCNSKALALCGITANTQQVNGGRFDVDEFGEPIGIFRENAMGLLASLQTPLSVDDQVELLKKISRIANSYGITSVQTNDLTIGKDGSKEMELAYQRYTSDHPTVRIYHQTSFFDLDAFKKRIEEGYHEGETPFHRFGPVKLFIDGSLGARTALMRAPYADDPSTSGIECMSQASLDEWVQTAHTNSIQVAIHAIGDGAMTMVLDAYQKVIRAENTNRHGIVHCQITDIPILHRFKEMDILAYIQPIFLHYDMHIVEGRVGKSLASTSYAFNTMEILGIHTAYGTDSPVEGLNVFHNIHCAVNRQDLSMFPADGFYPLERVDIETAIDRLTIGSAYASFEEYKKGRLFPGYVADLVVLDQPIFDLDKSLLKDVNVELTMIDGQIVYDRQSFFCIKSLSSNPLIEELITYKGS